MADWEALEIGMWIKVAAILDNTYDKASMRLACKTFDLAASLAVTQLPGRLGRHTRELHTEIGEK